MLARYRPMLSSCVRLSVRLSVISRCCIETTGRIEVSFSTHCIIRKLGYLQKIRHFPLGLCPKLRNRKFKTCRRRLRRLSSLLTTPIRQSTSRGCLLQVDQLLPSNSISDLWICCTTCSHSCAAVDTARRAVRLQ